MPGTYLSFTVVDGKGEESEIVLPILGEGEYTLADLYFAVITALPVLRNLMVGGIPRARMSLDVGLADLFSSFPSLPVPEEYADVEEGAAFTFRTEENRDFKQRIPTLDETLLIPGTREIDFADLRVVAYVEMMTTGIVTPGPTLRIVDSHEFYIESADTGVEDFKPRKRKRKNRRG